MKKLIVGLLATFLMTAGLVAGTSSVGATAAGCTNPSYQGCIATETNAIGLKTMKRHKARIFVRVSSFGNGQPTGTLNFTFVNRRGQSVTYSRPYPSQSGRPNLFNFRGLPGGKYQVIVAYIPASNTNYTGSSDTAQVKVKGNKRRR